MNGHSLTPWGANDLDLCSKAKAHQTIDFGFLNFSKTSIQARDMVFLALTGAQGVKMSVCVSVSVWHYAPEGFKRELRENLRDILEKYLRERTQERALKSSRGQSKESSTESSRERSREKSIERLREKSRERSKERALRVTHWTLAAAADSICCFQPQTD